MRKTDDLEEGFERRQDRAYREGGQWYYHTRHGRRGPFETRGELQEDLGRYVEVMAYLDEHPEALPEDLDPDDITHIDLKPPQY